MTSEFSHDLNTFSQNVEILVALAIKTSLLRSSKKSGKGTFEVNLLSKRIVFGHGANVWATMKAWN
jgi:hypothetical protein